MDQPLPLIDRIERLAVSLERSGLIREARELRGIAADRVLWDRMALRVVRFVRSEVLDRVKGSTRVEAVRLVTDLESELPLAFEEAVYEPIRRYAADLSRAGFRAYGDNLERGLWEGSTGTEIFMALRWSLKRLLQEPELPPALEAKGEELLRTIEDGLDEAG